MPALNLPGLILDRTHPLSRGLVGWWPMNEGGGVRVNELVSYNAGGINGGYKWEEGIKLDGSTGYVRVPHNPALAIIGDFSCLVMGCPITSGVYSGLVTKTNGNTGRSWDWYIHADNTIRAIFATTSTSGTRQPNFGRWNQFGFIASGTTIIQYLNGSENGTATNLGARADSGNDVIIGSRGDLFTKFPGPMRHARIYNRALSAAEVAQLYADPLAGAYATRARTLAQFAPKPTASDRLLNRSFPRIWRRGETG